MTAIVLNQQSLSSAAPSASSQFSHHLSLLSSRSESQRRDALSYLTSAITGRRADARIQQPVAIMLPKLLPLTLDSSNGVRTQLLKLLRALPVEDIKGHMDSVSLYIRAALTHLAADIRKSALETLDWALEVGSEQLVSCPGGWAKNLKTLLTALAWTDDATLGSWTSGRAVIGRSVLGNKGVAKTLNVLAAFLTAGLGTHFERDGDTIAKTWPLWHAQSYLLPTNSNPYRYLNLFGELDNDPEGQGYEGREERQNIFAELFEKKVMIGATAARKEGGEVGRAAAMIVKVVEDSLGSIKG